METLEQELKSVIAKRLEAASSREVLAIASVLCNGNASAPQPQPLHPGGIKTVEPGGRFEVTGDAVLDRASGLVWSRENVPGGRMNWKNAKDACAKLTLGGFSDWRLPTIRELLTLVDYERHDPSIDTDAFKCDSSYYWSSTPVHSSPGGYAWGVSFGDGGAGWLSRDNGCFVRAVRASQSLDLWHVR
jgi:hypothetical protein